jgi:hypothetical protein
VGRWRTLSKSWTGDGIRPGDHFDPDFMRPRDDRGHILAFAAEVRELHALVERLATAKTSRG